MNEIVKKHRYLKRCLTRCYETIAQTTGDVELNMSLETLSDTFREFKENHRLWCLELDEEDEDELDKQMEEFAAVERAFQKQVGNIKRRLKESESVSGSNSVNTSMIEVKLPPLELPVFEGTAMEWPSFVDLFNSAVGRHGQLSEAQKLQYLKSSMRGEAGNLIRPLPTTDAAYAEAWSLLRARYENCREIINEHLSRLFQLENSDGSSKSLRNLLDCSNECRKAMELLKQSKEDALFNYIIWQKLDLETQRSWELSLQDDEIPRHSDMLRFLERRAKALMNQQKQQEKDTGMVATKQQADSIKCPACQGNHFAFSCERFRQASVKEREALTRAGRLCFKCLKPNHGVSSCTAKKCRKCTKNHHTLLHKDPVPSTSAHANCSSMKTTDRSSTKSRALLATAIVHVRDGRQEKHECRALLDMGSTVSFITEKMVETLGLRKRPTNLTWSGVGGKEHGIARAKVDVTASSLLDENVKFQAEAYVIENITEGQSCTGEVNVRNWKHIQGLRLADPKFFEIRNVDLLIGVDVLPRIMKEGIRKGEGHLPIAQDTELGWVLFGSIPEPASERAEAFFIDGTLESQVKRFWELEDVEVNRLLSEEEQQCEEYFKSTVKRDEEGRYVVRLPFRKGQTIQENKIIAFQRFLSLERKFKKNKAFKIEYTDAIRDFQRRDHLRPVKEDCETTKAYLSHHAVVKPESETTKVRIVFDASAKTNNGRSLNDTLMNGPKLQDDLIDILMRFRQHQVVFTADIEKMYRQIRLAEADYNYHRIFWREERNLPIQEFYLTTVTFGIKSSPYLATRVLQQLAEDEGSKFPEAAPILRRDFYMDDLLSGCSNSKEAEKVCTQLDKLLAAGGFTLRKWASNDTEALRGIPQERTAHNTDREIDEGEFIKILGLKWNPKSDSFSFKVNDISAKRGITKRIILSNICRTFDPLGWLSPFTIRGKIIFQELWKESLNWDDPIPGHILAQWTSFKEEEKIIGNITIPRKVVAADIRDLTLCGFADASEKAYAAVVYLRGVNTEGEVEVKLLVGKTRVAPIKVTSVPRLELNAALLLAKLIRRVLRNIAVQQIRAWTDSTVVLAWIRGDPAKWKSYVAHRVSKIQEIVDKTDWFHITSENNPADCASRGISGQELLREEIWWKGPKILYQELDHSSAEPPPVLDVINEELKPRNVIVNYVSSRNEFLNELLHRVSEFSKLLRITAYMQRFIKKCKKEFPQGEVHYLSCKEIKAAEWFWIKVIQKEHFAEEYKCLEKEKELPRLSKVVTLNPFLDEDGLIRVGGRLRNMPVRFEQRHPLLLPQKSLFTTLLVRHFHVLNCHMGGTALLGNLRRKYWIINGRHAIRKVLIECLKCHRLKAKGVLQQMANLPPSRVAPAPAFNTCGVDYAGPILLKNMTGRKGNHKGYIAVFVCFSTKAIHLELVSSLTTQAFIAALRRFVGRRGLCYTIYSDCGTNFVGANRELKKMLKIAEEECRHEEIAKTLSEQGIQWRFNPPGSPHFGGLWEAGVKSVKTHLYRVLGNAVLNFEEMTTVLAQIESCLNSRPLSEMSSDPTDLEVLTPGHFLIGRPLRAIPEPDLTAQPENRLVRFQLCQRLVQHFWKRWSSEYLSRLQCRPKWMRKETNLAVGQLVLLREDNLSPLFWKLGRITEIHPGPDGLVRVVSVRTSSGIKKRCVKKIAALPVNSKDQSMNEM